MPSTHYSFGCNFSGMIMELKLVIKENSEVIMGVHQNSIKIIEAMVSWAKWRCLHLEMLNFNCHAEL